MNVKFWFLFLIILFSVATKAQSETYASDSTASSQSRLLQADHIRLSNREKSKDILADIDVSQLSSRDRALHQYLLIYHSSFDGNLFDTFKRYKLLLPSIQDRIIRIRVLQSMINIASYNGRWSEGFYYAEQLKQELDKNTSERALIEASKGLISFYKNASLPDIALDYLLTAQNLKSLTADDKCYFSSFKNELEYSHESKFISEEVFLKTRDLCKRVDNSYYATLNLTYLLYHYMQTGRLNLAVQIMPKVKKQVDKHDAIYLTTIFYAKVAKLFLLNKEYTKAEHFAMRAVSLDEKAENILASIISYEVLVELAKERGNYKQAVDYLEFLQENRNQFNSQEIARQIGFQQARFESQQKQNKINLLDNQNKLLTVESELVTREKESFLMALFLMLFILLVLLVWSFLSRRNQKNLEQLARTDTLTGLYNRGYFTEYVKSLLESAKKQNTTATLLLLDLDYFKQVNDAYGHQTGDWALCEVVSTIKKRVPANVAIGRMGGEEFGILLENATVDDGLKLAELCREAICQVNTDATGYQFSLSASFGVSDTNQVGYKLENLIAASDLALFQSKQHGRNQVYEYVGNEQFA
ncbi:GGDEF domain-containing protein [Alteromonas sp. ASW11-130]|uniref:GGDEF domain-containing protein n=1 Tax=Alteromonas sp. ASW11-130 TaxID=3015775 RepID=UPI0022419F44|nr:GGDEF domain-containing protein [Alteromonas sp. ASW11-130]MCW8092092.1 GGDEF domain-containing protein [Alteromonas sp. ASW11-130]